MLAEDKVVQAGGGLSARERYQSISGLGNKENVLWLRKHLSFMC